MATYRSTGDYVIAGPDGHRYYDIIGVSPWLIQMYENLALAYRLALRRPGGTGRAQATEISLLLKEVQRRMDRVSVRTASVATKSVRDRIAATRKRPMSLKGTSQSGRLSGGVVSRPLHLVLPRGSGAVGVGQVEPLEAATKSGHRTKSKYPYYWRTQEDGSRAMVGKTLYGVFQPGQSLPSGGQRRVHPIFEVRGAGGGKRGKMVIRNPVEARNFLKDGANLARLFRHEATGTVERFAIARMNVISGTRVALPGPKGLTIPGRGRYPLL